MSNSDRQSLVYVVNRVSQDDSQHFVHIPNLLGRLGEHGWDVRLVSERGGKGDDEIGGIPVTYLSEEGRWSRIPALLRTLVGARRQGNRLVFVRISKSAALVAGLAGRLFGWKTLYWLCGAVEDYNLREKGMRGRIEIAFQWLLFRIVDHLVTGPETMNRYYRDYYGLAERKVVTLYNDVETASDGAGSAKRREEGSLRLLMVHRYSPVRETLRWFGPLLAMLQRRRTEGQEIRFDIVGGGPELDDMKRVARNYDLDLHFHGVMPNREIDPYYDAADLFVMPSYREGFPRVAIEAMARSLPLVATDAGGTRDLFGPLQEPYCIDRDDVEGFTEATEKLIDSADLRAALARENFEQSRRFSTPAVARQYDREFRRILAGR